MSKRLDVLRALVALIAAALPNADVAGLDDETAAPKRVGPGGQVIVRSGDPGEADVDLCPLTYHYEHQIPVEVVAHNEATLDALLIAIGEAVEADRSLGGLCDWIEPAAAATQDIVTDNAAGLRGAPLTIAASYSTSNPLT